MKIIIWGNIALEEEVMMVLEGKYGYWMVWIAALNTGLYPPQFVGYGEEGEGAVWSLWFLLIQYWLNSQ